MYKSAKTQTLYIFDFFQMVQYVYFSKNPLQTFLNTKRSYHSSIYCLWGGLARSGDSIKKSQFVEQLLLISILDDIYGVEMSDVNGITK